MQSNMGTADKVIRSLAALVVIALYYTDQISGVAAIILLVVAGFMILSSMIGYCPAYLPFGLSTKKK